MRKVLLLWLTFLVSLCSWGQEEYYTITVEADPSEGGDVYIGISDGEAPARRGAPASSYNYIEVEEGTGYYISAYAKDGYVFIGWDDGNTEYHRYLTANDNMDWVAYFEEIQQITVFAVNTYEWDDMYAYIWNSEDEYTGWHGEQMTKTDMQVEGKDVYSYTFSAVYTNIIFNNGSNNQTDDLTWNAAKPYWYNGQWYASLDDFTGGNSGVQFYITGNAALAGEEKAWKADAIPVTGDSYTFENLPAGEYKMKITLDGTWQNNYGYYNLTSKEGVMYDDDGNICFTLSQYANVTVIYTGSIFTVTIEQVANPNELVYSYDTEGRTATVIYKWAPEYGQSGYASGKVVIPENVEKDGITYIVTGIADFAFHDCRQMTEVIVGDNVKRIGDFAFHNCSGLEKITVGKSVEHIGSAFTGDCSQLSSVVWRSDKYADGKDWYGYGSAWDKDDFEIDEESGYDNQYVTPFVFYVDYALNPYQYDYEYNEITGYEEVKVEDYDWVESNCRWEDDETQPIYEWQGTGEYEQVWDDCASEEWDDEEEDYVCVGDWVDGDEIEEEVLVGYEQTEVCDEEWAVVGSHWEEDYDRPIYETVSDFEYFYYTYDIREQITSFVFEGEMTAIPAYLCTGLRNVSDMQLPSTITKIDSVAFAGCSSWSNVAVPAGLTYLGAGAFAYTQLTELEYPQALSVVPERAFNGNQALHYLTLHEGVTRLYDYAFGYCSLLDTIVVWAATPPAFTDYTDDNVCEPELYDEEEDEWIVNDKYDSEACSIRNEQLNTNAFYQVPRGEDGPLLFVPEASMDKYAQADVWKEFTLRSIESMNDPYIQAWVARDGELSFSRAYSSVATAVEDTVRIRVHGNYWTEPMQASIHANSGVFTIDETAQSGTDATVDLRFRLETTNTDAVDTLVLTTSGIEKRMLLRLDGFITEHAGTDADPLTVDELIDLQDRRYYEVYTYSYLNDLSLTPGTMFVRGVVYGADNEVYTYWQDENNVSFHIGVTGDANRYVYCELNLENSISLNNEDILPYDTITLRMRDYPQEYGFSVTGYDHTDIVAIGRYTRLMEEELELLRAAYEKMGNGEGWTRPWDLSSAAAVRQSDAFTVRNGYITGIDMSGNNIYGALPEELFQLPYLEWIDASDNHIDSLETLPDEGVNLTIDRQDLTHKVYPLDLTQSKTIEEVFPNVTLYFGYDGTFFIDGESDYYLYYDDEDNRIRVNYWHCDYYTHTHANGEILDALSYEGDISFRLRIRTVNGDADFNGAFDINDLQSVVNYIFEDFSCDGVLNLPVADFYTDNRITVQDAVRMVDSLLARNEDTDDLYLSPRRNKQEEDMPQAALTWKNGELHLNALTEVAAMDLVMDNAEVEWLLPTTFDVETSVSNDRLHAVVWSLSGDALPAMQDMVIARAKNRMPDIRRADMSDRKARPVTAETQTISSPTGTETLSAEGISRWVIYDMAARHIASGESASGLMNAARSLPQGVYTVQIEKGTQTVNQKLTIQ